MPSIQEIQSIVSHKGGKCLSKEYISDYSPLKWMCQKGHTWESALFIINQGGWCRQCLKDERVEEIRKEKLEELKAFAISKGGICLSETYKDSHHKINFLCANAHTFSQSKEHLKNGFWCKTCNRNAEVERIFSAIKSIVEKQGGKCLSSEYISTMSKMQWQCSKGHTWSALPKGILQGQWCAVCFHNKLKEINTRFTIAGLQQHAEKLGGKLLTKEYNYKQPVHWQCSKGHVWNAKASPVVNYNQWCKLCAIENSKLSIKEFQKIAESHGGKLLSEQYITINDKLKWQCSKGHIWEAVASNVKGGTWCRKCNTENSKLTIELFQNIAKERGGKLLSEKYIRINSKLKWQCSKGHTWEAKPDNIKKGSWCKICSIVNSRTPIEVFQEIAKKKGGKLLSTEFITIQTHLLWECAKGHTWKTTPATIKKGSWCPVCMDTKLSLQQLHPIAESRGGKLLSQKYINSKTPLQWQCSKGHKWMAASNNIKNGTWCGICSRNAHDTD